MQTLLTFEQYVLGPFSNYYAHYSNATAVPSWEPGNYFGVLPLSLFLKPYAFNPILYYVSFVKIIFFIY